MNERDAGDADQLAWGHLRKFGQLAHNDASLELLLVVATAAGVTEINGVPLRAFFESRKSDIVERLIADYSDINPNLASQMKAVWKKFHCEPCPTYNRTKEQ
jgi:hypothetical protein